MRAVACSTQKSSRRCNIGIICDSRNTIDQKKKRTKQTLKKEVNAIKKVKLVKFSKK